MSSITVDDDAWPLVIARFVGTYNDNELEEFLAQLDRYLARREPHVILIDAMQLKTPTMAQRHRGAFWLRDNAAEIAKYWIGVSFALGSGPLRFVLSTIFIIQPLPVPHAIFSNLEQALAWGRARLPSESPE